MKQILICIFSVIAISSICANEILATVERDTVIYRDYEQKLRIGLIRSGEIVSIETQDVAHKEDNNYWGFNILVNNASIRIQYKNMKGYISFFDLQSTKKENIKKQHLFTEKVLIPVSYCNTLFYRDTKFIEDTDPFILKYDKGIEYFFIDDRHHQWEYNYPVNYSFGNDLFFQFSSIPSRYTFAGFIIEVTNNSFTCIIDSNIDMFELYDSITKYEVGKMYRFNYKCDGDYITVFDGDTKIFDGVYVNKTTWDYIYFFIKRKNEQYKYKEYFVDKEATNIRWPCYADGSCDYR